MIDIFREQLVSISNEIETIVGDMTAGSANDTLLNIPRIRRKINDNLTKVALINADNENKLAVVYGDLINYYSGRTDKKSKMGVCPYVLSSATDIKNAVIADTRHIELDNKIRVGNMIKNLLENHDKELRDLYFTIKAYIDYMEL